MKSIANWALPVLLIGALTAPALAQAQAPAAAQQEPKWKNNKEYIDYMLVYDEQDHAKKAANAEKFFVDHKDADPIAINDVFKRMYLAYANAGNWVKVLESYDRMGTLGPQLTGAEKHQYTQIALIAATNSKNNARTIEIAEAILKGDPNNFNALITLSGVLSQTLPSGPEKDAQITRTLEVTRKALAQPRPQGVSDAQWNPIQVQLHDTACLLLLNQKKHQESIEECQAAIKINPQDGYAWYWIGLSHRASLIDLANKYKAAVDKYNENRATAGQLALDELRSEMQGAQKVASDKRDETEQAFKRAAAIGGEAGKQAEAELQKL